ncbi:hypothetical protein ACOJBO_00440 [Rhizobium beringeri]
MAKAAAFLTIAMDWIQFRKVAEAHAGDVEVQFSPPGMYAIERIDGGWEVGQ